LKKYKQKRAGLALIVLILLNFGQPWINDLTTDIVEFWNSNLLKHPDKLYFPSLYYASEEISQWNLTYGGNGDDWATSVIQTADGGFAFTGATGSYGKAGFYDAWLVKTDDQGIIKWNQTYGSMFDDATYSIIQTSDGGYILAGNTGITQVGCDGLLLKTDANGKMEWNQTYSREWAIHINTIIQTIDNGYALAGYVLYLQEMHFDALLMKTDTNGEVQWERTFGGLGTDKFVSGIQTIDGGYALVGYTTSFGAGKEDFLLMKIDSEGFVKWTQTYGGENKEMGNSIVQTSDGGFALIGHTTSFEAGASDAWFVKTDVNGLMKWNRLYGDFLIEWNRVAKVTWEEGQAIIQVDDGGFVLAGLIESTIAKKDVWIMKINANGVIQWNQIHGGSANENVNALIKTNDGGLMLAGYSSSFGAGDRDAWLVKTGAYGTSPPTRYISDLIILIIFTGLGFIRFLEIVYPIAFIGLITFVFIRFWKNKRQR